MWLLRDGVHGYSMWEHPQKTYFRPVGNLTYISALYGVFCTEFWIRL